MIKNFDMRQKKVIDLESAEQIGYIKDIDVDVKTGVINSVTIPMRGRLGTFFGGKSVVVPWEQVISIGNEYIIVKRKKSESTLTE